MKKQLNHLLANCAVEAQKLQSFHWYVKGHDFFPVHAKTEELYHAMAQHADDVAELILQLGGKPLANMKAILAEADIKERKDGHTTSDKIYPEIADDLQAMYDDVVKIREQAEKDDVAPVAVLMDELVGWLSKTIWMLRQSL